MENVKCSKPGYARIICTKIENIPDKYIFATKCNDSLNLISNISWDYMN
jgi:hypothetical protein